MCRKYKSPPTKQATNSTARIAITAIMAVLSPLWPPLLLTVLLLEFDGDAEEVVAGVVEDRLDWGEVALLEVDSVEVASVEVWLTVISAVKNYSDE